MIMAHARQNIMKAKGARSLQGTGSAPLILNSRASQIKPIVDIKGMINQSASQIKRYSLDIALKMSKTWGLCRSQ